MCPIFAAQQKYKFVSLINKLQRYNALFYRKLTAVYNIPYTVYDNIREAVLQDSGICDKMIVIQKTIVQVMTK